MQRKRRKKRVNKKRVIISLIMLFLFMIVLIWLLLSLTSPKKISQTTKSPSKTTSASTKGQSTAPSTKSLDTPLQTASRSDWQLVLVNLKNKKPEMNPNLVSIENIQMDARIQKNVKDFLAAARAVDPQVHLISGYRSVAYQTGLFQSYVNQTLSENPGWTEAKATAEVMTYSQPPEASEHETGLAMDMSTIDSLNEEDPNVAKQLADMAPTYGFILRFPDWGRSSTGIEYEDWHFRYVGEANAKYITAQHLTLEDFLAKLSR